MPRPGFAANMVAAIATKPGAATRPVAPNSRHRYRSPFGCLPRPAQPLPTSSCGRRRPAVCWALFKAMGVPKPRWLPDLGVAQRRAVLQRFFGPISRPVYDELLDPGFHMSEQLRGEVAHARTYGKDDWIELMCGCVAPAIPDFNWSAATDGRADADGWALVTVQATGHHTGTQFELPGRPPVAPSGRRVRLEPELMKVRVEGGRVHEIVVLPSEGAGPAALYAALAADT